MLASARLVILLASCVLLRGSPVPPAVVQNYEQLLEALLADQLSGDETLQEFATTPLEITTADGTLKAERISQGDSVWVRARGVQYAEHPTGSLRWQPPVPRERSNAIMDATRFGPDCINAPLSSRLSSIGLSRASESCLYLNVWAPGGEPPRGAAPQKVGQWPVLFWIHGGSFTSGGTSIYSGDGIFSYRRDMVLVTANYRLGALGWLGGAAVARNTSDGSAGNFGLQVVG